MEEIADYESIESIPKRAKQDFNRYSGLNYELNSLFTLLDMRG
jgi:hypothetical protein